MPAPQSPWSIAYHDGSANAYQIASDGEGATLEYTPITPERSSTGMYSGGDPRLGRLGPEAIESLWKLVDELEGNTPLHTDERGKGTGAFRVMDARGARDFIIEMGPAIRAFDAFLRTLP